MIDQINMMDYSSSRNTHDGLMYYTQGKIGSNMTYPHQSRHKSYT